MSFNIEKWLADEKDDAEGAKPLATDDDLWHYLDGKAAGISEISERLIAEFRKLEAELAEADKTIAQANDGLARLEARLEGVE